MHQQVPNRGRNLISPQKFLLWAVILAVFVVGLSSGAPSGSSSSSSSSSSEEDIGPTRGPETNELEGYVNVGPDMARTPGEVSRSFDECSAGYYRSAATGKCKRILRYFSG